MKNMFKNFLRNESGATSIDYVVMSAFVAVLGVSATASLGSGSVGLANSIVAAMVMDTDAGSEFAAEFATVAKDRTDAPETPESSTGSSNSFRASYGFVAALFFE